MAVRENFSLLQRIHLSHSVIIQCLFVSLLSLSSLSFADWEEMEVDPDPWEEMEIDDLDEDDDEEDEDTETDTSEETGSVSEQPPATASETLSFSPESASTLISPPVTYTDSVSGTPIRLYDDKVPSTRNRKKPEQIKVLAGPLETPVVKLLYEADPRDERLMVIRLEENRLKLDSNGQAVVIIDAAALPPEIIDNAVAQLQLSLRYRKHCSWGNVRKDPWSLTSDLITQEISAKPLRDYQYKLNVSLCPEDAGKTFILKYSKKKTIRSVVSKFGSAMGYLALAKYMGRWSTKRVIAGNEVRIPDGENGSFADTLAATLPAGAVFNGLSDLTESMGELSGYDSGLFSCVTSALSFSAMHLFDRGFQSDTSQMFISNAGRLYSRSAYFGELYRCIKTLVDIPVYHQYAESHNTTETPPEAMSSHSVALIQALMVFAFDMTYAAELDMLEKQGSLKLELATHGTTVRGGAASAPYKLLGATDLYLQDETWGSFASRAFANTLWYIGGAALFSQVMPLKTQNTLKQNQILGSQSLLGLNFMEAATAQMFSLFDEVVSKPLGDMAADYLVMNDHTVPDSYFQRASRVTVRLGINWGAVWTSVTATNKLASWRKSKYSDVKGVPNTRKINAGSANQRFFIDALAGTTTNGMMIPLVLTLGDDFITPVSDGATYYLCTSNNWGVGCPTTELQFQLLVDNTGTLAADTHEVETIEVAN